MEAPVHPGSIVILDFGGQYAHLIGSRVRRLGAFSEIHPPEIAPDVLKGAAGIILSGGPQSVYEEGSPQADPKILELGIPILGLCYGHQWLAQALGGTVAPAKTKEYGDTRIRVTAKENPLFAGLPTAQTVWMSHGDEVQGLPPEFSVTASSEDCAIAAMENGAKKIFGIQFHIEVTHTKHGMDILDRFVRLCRPAPWSIESYAQHIGAQIKEEIGDRNVFMLVSGGVDSTVAFTLLNEALGPERVQGLLVDTGLMRKNEVGQIKEAMDALGITNLHIEDASEEFFRNLEGIYDPEEKRKIIGNTFLDVQKRVFDRMGLSTGGQRLRAGNQRATWCLGQGTIYPDTIETGGTKHADHIKTHHNRVPAIQKMIDEGLVIEPLKELYKDEVRILGEELGLPHALVWRHPFPGPGLGVRIVCATKPEERQEKIPQLSTFNFQLSTLPVRSVGVQGDGRTYRHALAVFAPALTDAIAKSATEIPNRDREINRVLLCTSHQKPVDFVFTPGFITRSRADLLREADAVVDTVMRQAGLYETIWQFPVVLLPFGTSTGGQSIVLRPISSSDAMTANAFTLPPDILRKMTEGIVGLTQGDLHIDCVFLDLTNKPPATIEWE